MTLPKRFKIFDFTRSIYNAFVPDTENKSKEIYNYGKNNDLPNQWISYIAESGVATRAVGKLSEYIFADGFNEEKSAELKVNNKQSADSLFSEVSRTVAMFDGLALHISRKTTGEIASVKSVPFQCVRKKTDGSFEFNPTYGQPKFDSTKTVTYRAYYGEKLPIGMLKDYSAGEILYLYNRSPFNSYYPIPDYYSQIEDIRSSSELAKFDLETVLNGFVTSMMLTFIGTFDDTTKDAYNKTELDYAKEELQMFTGQVKDSNGLSGRNKAFISFAKTRDEAPILQQFDIKGILDGSNSKREAIERAVCRLFGIHPVLMGYSDAAVLGNTQAISNASVELNKVVANRQRLIREAFEMLYPTFDWSTSDYMPLTYIEPSLYADMTQDERRNKFLGLPPLQITPDATNN